MITKNKHILGIHLSIIPPVNYFMAKQNFVLLEQQRDYRRNSNPKLNCLNGTRNQLRYSTINLL